MIKMQEERLGKSKLALNPNIRIKEQKQKTMQLPFYLIQEAKDYAQLSSVLSGDRHDFRPDQEQTRQEKFFQGKLGEGLFKMFLLNNFIQFKEDPTEKYEADEYDFLINDLKIDVKTRTKDYYIRTLETVEQFTKKPKDIYVSIKLNPEAREGFIVGWCTKEDIKKVNRIQNNGFLDNFVMYDNELRDTPQLIEELKK